MRSTRPPVPAELSADAEGITVTLADGETGVAPGQACVLYDSGGAGARVLGGGWIERTERVGDAEAALRALVTAPSAAAVA